MPRIVAADWSQGGGRADWPREISFAWATRHSPGFVCLAFGGRLCRPSWGGRMKKAMNNLSRIRGIGLKEDGSIVFEQIYRFALAVAHPIGRCTRFILPRPYGFGSVARPAAMDGEKILKYRRSDESGIADIPTTPNTNRSRSPRPISRPTMYLAPRIKQALQRSVCFE